VSNLDPGPAAAAKPAHIPDSVVYEFDMFRDRAYLENPHNRILGLTQEAPPVFWTPLNGGHWMIISHAAVFAAARDTALFSSEVVSAAQLKAMEAKLPPGSPHIPHAIPIGVDPPAHTKYRAPLNKAFSPTAVLALKDDIRALADVLIDNVVAKGRCEFMSEIAEPLPVQVFLKMLGLPLERMEEYRTIVSEHLADSNSSGQNMIQRLWRITAIMRPTILERRQEPRNDVISLLWRTQIDGAPTTLDDLENYCVVLFIAGLDTVMNGMGHGVRHLAMNPALQEQLRADPKLVPQAAEELLRRYTFTVPLRIVAQDAVFQGVQLKKGERAMLFLPAADLDSKEFVEPDRFELKRDKVHIAFNAGPHRCLGSHLARIELQVVYEQLLKRLPPFKLDSERPSTYHGGHVIGIDSLHLVWS
jgi:cytochrome P450